MPGKAQDIVSRAFEALPQPVLIIAADGRVLSSNATARKMLPAGREVSQVLAVEPNGSFAWQDEFACLARGSGSLTRRNVALAGQGDRRLVVDLHLGLLEGAGGDGQDAAVVVVQDVSARASMERLLAASERMAAVGELAGKVGHELNNPLDGVLRYIGLAERQCTPKVAEYLGKARTGLGRMSEVIRELTDEAAACRSANQPVDKLLDEAVTVMGPRAAALGVSVACDITREARLKVPGRVFQVFCNVIKNSLDAMPGGGLLKIALRCDGRGCIAEFADTGCGFDEDHAEDIFQPFFSTKPPGEGAGLGLTICREILARLGGTITAANRPEGGVLVTVRMPLGPEQKATTKEQ
jgi:signal transduction histidine kinase